MDMLGALIGGLGLFLLAVGMMTDGLRMAAGEALRDLLGRWTRTPLRGIGAGALITGIVQSSGAVTIATIGFVNANLLTMHQALGVVYGANIGTTMTGWLVAIVGFKIKVEAFALPMIGIGMLLRLSGANSRRGAIGTALAGFGLFFIGLEVLRETFEGLAQGMDLSVFNADTALGMLVFVLIGFAMTVMTQSSSAAIAVTLTAASGGLIGLHPAAAVVIGANVGSTSTAVFAAIAATPNARRVAAAHVVFNLTTATVALLLLPVMLWLVQLAGRMLQLEAAPAVILALFHTLFNVLGVLLLWPFTGRLSAMLQKRFVTPAEDLSRPRYIDATTVSTPLLAQDAMRLELQRVGEMVARLAGLAMQRPADRRRIQSMHQAVYVLCERIEDAVARLERRHLTQAETMTLPDYLRLSRRLREAADAALRVTDGEADVAPARGFTQLALEILAGWQAQQLLGASWGEQLHTLKSAYADARQALLEATAAGQYRPAHANSQLDQLRSSYRMLEQLGKAARRLDQLSQDATLGPLERASSTAEDGAS